MTDPRNRKAFARGQRAREAVRAACLRLIERQPFRRRHTARHVRLELPTPFRGLSERTLQWHMRQIELEADLTGLGCGQRNSSSDTEAA